MLANIKDKIVKVKDNKFYDLKTGNEVFASDPGEPKKEYLADEPSKPLFAKKKKK